MSLPLEDQSAPHAAALKNAEPGTSFNYFLALPPGTPALLSILPSLGTLSGTRFNTKCKQILGLGGVSSALCLVHFCLPSDCVFRSLSGFFFFSCLWLWISLGNLYLDPGVPMITGLAGLISVLKHE